MTAEVRTTIDAGPCSLPHRPPRFSESCLTQPAWTTTMKRTEQNLIVRSGKSDVEVTSNRTLLGRLGLLPSVGR